MAIVEQRKAILEDGHGKSLEEIQEWLKKSGFNLKRGYTTLRGESSILFVQDTDENSEKNHRPVLVKNKYFGLSAKFPDPEEAQAIVNSPAGKDFDAMITLLAEKMGKRETLTPVEALLAKMFAERYRCYECGEDQ